MNELYVIQCNDNPHNAPWAYAVCKTFEEAVQHAQECDTFRFIELYTLKNGIFKHTGKYFNVDGNPVDYEGNPLNNKDFDSEINDTLRIAGINNKDKDDESFKRALDNYAFWD